MSSVDYEETICQINRHLHDRTFEKWLSDVVPHAGSHDLNTVTNLYESWFIYKRRYNETLYKYLIQYGGE